MRGYQKADFMSKEEGRVLSLSGLRRKEVALRVMFKDGGSERVTYSSGIGLNPCSRSEIACWEGQS